MKEKINKTTIASLTLATTRIVTQVFANKYAAENKQGYSTKTAKKENEKISLVLNTFLDYKKALHANTIHKAKKKVTQTGSNKVILFSKEINRKNNHTFHYDTVNNIYKENKRIHPSKRKNEKISNNTISKNSKHYRANAKASATARREKLHLNSFSLLKGNKKSLFFFKRKISFQSVLKKILVIHILCTHNNTIFSLASPDVNFCLSAGMCGFKNSRKGTRYAAEKTAEKVALMLKKIQNNSTSNKAPAVCVKIKGIGPGKTIAVRTLFKLGIKFFNVQDCSLLAHNGCRLAKVRRL